MATRSPLADQFGIPGAGVARARRPAPVRSPIRPTRPTSTATESTFVDDFGIPGEPPRTPGIRRHTPPPTSSVRPRPTNRQVFQKGELGGVRPPVTGRPPQPPPITDRGGGGRPPQPPAPPAPAPPPPVAGPQIGGTTPTPITGDEVPMQINPGRSDDLQGVIDSIVSGAGGGGADADLDVALKEKALSQLDNPTAFDDDLFQKSLAQAQGNVGRFTDDLFTRLDEKLAGRGVSFGNLAAEEFGDAGATAARFQNDLLLPLLRDKAAALGSARSSAFANASNLTDRNTGRRFGAAGLLGGLEQGERGELRGERAFNEDLRGTARNEAIEELVLGENIRRGRDSDFREDLRLGANQANAGSAGFERSLADIGRQYGLTAQQMDALLAEAAQGAFG